MRTLLLLLCSLNVALAEDEVQLNEVGVTLPQKIAGIEHVERKSYGSKELGYSQGYRSKMCIITLYVYDRGQEDIPDGIEDDRVVAESERAASEVKQAQQAGLYRNVKSLEGELKVLEPVAEQFRASGFTFDVRGGGCRSYLLTCGRNKNFFKVRITQYIVNDQTNDEEVKEFLAVLARAMK